MREPFEPHRAAWHVVAVLIGIAALFYPPQGLALLVPGWVLYVWAAALIASAAVAIWAPLRQARDARNALAAERAALWCQSTTLVWIVVSALYYQGIRSAFGLVFYVVWIAANIVRDLRIASALTRLRKSGE